MQAGFIVNRTDVPLCELPECVRPAATEVFLKDVLERALEDPDTHTYT
jgi:hypothetical protein